MQLVRIRLTGFSLYAQNDNRRNKVCTVFNIDLIVRSKNTKQENVVVLPIAECKAWLVSEMYVGHSGAAQGRIKFNNDQVRP